MVTAARILFAVLAWWTVSSAQAAVEFEVSPEPIVANESCRLSFTVTGEADGEPDFSPLEAHFDIIGRNRQTSIAWINGKSEQSTSWVLSAMPLTTGRIEIPSIAFGAQRSAPKSVEVIAAPRRQANNAEDIILEVAADTTTPYVQQQVIYTIRLLHRVELSSPRFSALDTSADAVVKPLGDGRQYREQRSGTNYEVFEQRYAIFPQASGTLTIRPLALTTQIISRKRSFFDPFSQSLQTRRIESQAVTLEVRPIPASFPSQATWLPARRVRLHEEWQPDVDTAKVGAPLSRTVFLWADGLIAGQLPEITVSPTPGIKLYPDQAQSSDKDTATGFTAIVQQKFALIAGTPGRGTFAEIRLPWWNVETDSLETATLAARTVEFVGAALPAGSATTPTPATTADTGAAPVAPATGSAAGPQWSWLTAVAAGGWLLTALLWAASVWRRRPRAGKTTAREREVPTGARAARELKSACATHDANAAAAALRAWAQTLAPTSDPRARALREIAALAQTADLSAAIMTLDAALYGRSEAAWTGTALWAAFRLEPRARPVSTSTTRSPAIIHEGTEHNHQHVAQLF